MIVTIGGIPVYNATIPDDDCGMLKISLVDDPAVMSNFQAFDKEKKMMMYAITDEEKRLVHGVVMRADFPIYRYDKKLGEYYIIYKVDTIRQMAEKYLKESRQNYLNAMHEGKDLDDIYMVQYYIKDSAKGINPGGFDEIADGSLFAEFHVTNDDVWNAIKDGTYKGFSLEGVFGMEAEQDKESVEQIVDSLDGKFSRLFNKLSNKFNMTKLSRFKAALLKAFAEFANVTTDKGILAWDGDEDLKEGDAVFIEDADGNRTPAEDGDYKTDDNKVIVVVDGKVSEIKDAEAEVAPTKPTEEFSEVSTDNGVLSYEGELAPGTEVFVDQDGERVAAPDGEYKTEDGKIIKVVDGKVSEITEETTAPVEETKMSRCKRIMAAFSESYDEKVLKIQDAIKALGFLYGYVWEAGDDYAIYCYWIDDDWDDHYKRFDVSWDANGNAVVSNPVDIKRSFVPVDAAAPAPAPTEELETLRKQNEDLTKELETLRKQNEDLTKELETLRKQSEDLTKELETLRKQSGAKPAHDEVKDEQKFSKTGLKGVDKIAHYMSL